MTVSYTFRVVKMVGYKVKYTCSVCGKKRERKISREYTENPYHNWDETRQKKTIEMDKERYLLHCGGGVCTSCWSKDSREDVAGVAIPEGFKYPIKPPKPMSWKTPRRYLEPIINRTFTISTQAEYDAVLNGRLVDPVTGYHLLQISYNPEVESVSGWSLLEGQAMTAASLLAKLEKESGR